MTHRNAPLSVEGRRRLVGRCAERPIAHVAAEMGISRACASKWVNRFRAFGDVGLQDRSSTPHHQPTATPGDVVAVIEAMRREHKWSAARITFELHQQGTNVTRRTASRHLQLLGLNRRRFIDPSGQSNRKPQVITARRPGHMVHLDVKKTGRIPDGGGWRVHGKGSAQAKALAAATAGGARAGYVFLHTAVDGYSRLAYTEALTDEKASTAIGFMHRARAWFAAHGIIRIERIITDNGACYRADAFARAMLGSRHQRIAPYTPRHNGKVERYNRILAEEFLYAHTWTSERQRADALGIWNIHYNYHRPHSATGGQPPASQLATGVTNVVASYSYPEPTLIGVNAERKMRAIGGSVDLNKVEKVIDARYLSLVEREQIKDLHRTGMTIRRIAAALDRSPSTVNRELRRNTISTQGYLPHTAHRLSVARRARSRKVKLLANIELRAYVQAKLAKKWSPQQISNRLIRDFPTTVEMRVSTETIYEAIYVHARGELKRELGKQLRRGRAARKPRKQPDARR